MIAYKDLDPACPKFGTITLDRNFLLFHYWKKPRSRLIELVTKYSILDYPYSERTVTLANVLTDFSEVKQ